MRWHSFPKFSNFSEVKKQTKLDNMNLTSTYKDLSCKENHIGPATIEILIYIQTHR